MRIVGGAYRSRVLSTFDGDRIRPTSDKVRESLFNILQFKVIGCEFLDLFCGSGAVGLEAVSRGAKHVYFNDGASESLALAKKNALALKVENATFTLGDALRFFDKSKSFDIIFSGTNPAKSAPLFKSSLTLVELTPFNCPTVGIKSVTSSG